MSTCTKAKFNWAASELNTTSLISSSGTNVTLPKEVRDSIKTFVVVSKWTQVVYVIAFAALILELVVGLFGFFSRIGLLLHFHRFRHLDRIRHLRLHPRNCHILRSCRRHRIHCQSLWGQSLDQYILPGRHLGCGCLLHRCGHLLAVVHLLLRCGSSQEQPQKHCGRWREVTLWRKRLSTC